MLEVYAAFYRQLVSRMPCATAGHVEADLVMGGHRSGDVASQLGLSPKSIDTYRSRLMSKLDLDDLPALVKFAIRRGLTSA